ncbi:MAG: hypothetical protein CL561_02895 [Alphaproteobacteria bacterium]|nr:hypothetical protein [Alphaproteobacteria bacterium]|tara:strand:- start:1098 stop:1466 length:369 start_codon:yes stop_codon:yes gene_type:complete
MKNLLKKDSRGESGLKKAFDGAVFLGLGGPALSSLVLWDTVRGKGKADEFCRLFRDDRLNRAATIVASPVIFAGIATILPIYGTYIGVKEGVQMHYSDLDRDALNAERAKQCSDKNDQGPKV